MIDPCQGCQGESDYGAHGIRDREVYDEYWCEACYNKKTPDKELSIKDEDEDEEENIVHQFTFE